MDREFEEEQTLLSKNKEWSKKLMEKQKKKQNGITLIALVISIIVMLILAGVSLNMTVGDNGIIKQAQEATYAQSCAILEEWLQQTYVENYDGVEEYTEKIDGVLYGTDMKKYFQKAANNDMFFLDKTTYKEYYFIEKSALPNDLKNSLAGGATSLTGKTIYAEFNDIYGVTTDLKVYYCLDGYDSWLGAEDTAKETNLNRVVANSASGWGEILGIGNTDVTLSSLKATNGSLTINKSGLDLSFLVNIPNLNKLEFVNCSYSDLKGLEYAPDITQLYIEGTTSIADYSEVGKLTKLNQIYFIGSNDTEVARCFSKQSTGIGNFDFAELNYIALTNDDYRRYWSAESTSSSYDSGLTTIYPITNLSDATQAKITHINVSVNAITSLEGINQFSNLVFLKAGGNKITTLDGIEGLQKLRYLILSRNDLGYELDGTTIDDDVDALHAIATIKTTATKIEDYTFENTLPQLYHLDLTYNDNLVWVNYVKNCENLRYLYLTGDKKLNAASVQALKSKFNGYYWGYSYDSLFNLALKPLNTTSLNLEGEEYTKSVFESLTSYTELKSLNLKNVKIYTLKEDGSKDYITGTNLDTLANTVLGSFSNMYALGLNGWTTLSDISFVKNMTYLNNIDLRNTAVTTGTTKTVTNNGSTITYNTGLECLNDRGNMLSLAINGSTIDLSKIQPTINRLGVGKTDTAVYPAGYSNLVEISGASTGWGLRCENTTTFATLANCTNIERLNMAMQSWGMCYYGNMTLNLSSCTKLKSIWEYYAGNLKIITPTNLETISTGPASNVNYDLTASTKLISITISENDKTENILNSIRAYSTLTSISVSGGSTYNKLVNSVDNWSKCTSLTTLDISQSHWWYTYATISSLKFMEKLSNISNLTTLRMNYMDVSDKNWSYLSNLKYLTTITITNSSIEDISCFDTMTNLTTVNISSSKVVNGLYALSGKTNINAIYLAGTPMGDLSAYKSQNYNTIDILLNLRPAKGGSLTAWNFGTNQTADEKNRMK